MSILVVNSLKNSTGGSPTLTLPTTDGTSGQILSSTNNSGTLAFSGAQLEAQNGTNITFPASTSDNQNYITDANGNLTATTAGTNPMNTPDGAHQGERLLDKYVISGGTPTTSISLTTPTGYTSTDLNTIRNMRLVIRGLGLTSGSSWKPIFTFLIGKAGSNSNYYTAGSSFQSHYFTLGVSKYGSAFQKVQNYASQAFYINGYDNVYRSNNSASDGVDFFSNESVSGTNVALNGSNSLCFGEVIVDCNTAPVAYSNIQYFGSTAQADYKDESNMFCSRGTTMADGNNNGRHPMGIKISNSSGVNFTTGFVELYGMFKDGVVS